MPLTISPRFDRLVELHYSQLFHFAVRLSKSPETAIKLTQRAFHLAFDRSRDLPVPSDVRSWLFTILFREYLELRPRIHRTSRIPLRMPDLDLILKGNPQWN